MVEKDHVSRKKSDTYYLTEELLLRTHTSAYQNFYLKSSNKFCVFADVYRKDEIDGTHYPVFHQMEGVSVYETDQLKKYMQKNQLKIEYQELV